MRIVDASTTNDITDQTTSVIVGQKISLFCQLSATNWSPTNYQWTIPGWTISNYVANVDAGIVYSNYPTANSNVAFYWVDGATNRQVLCSAGVGGQKLSAKVVFNVQRPNVQMTAQVMGTIAADTNFAVANGTWLHFGGIIQGDNPIPGVKFAYTQGGSSGQYYFVQTGLSACTIRGEDGTNYSSQATGVDNRTKEQDYVYQLSPDFPGENAAIDAPASYLCNLYTNVYRQDVFAMFLEAIS